MRSFKFNLSIVLALAVFMSACSSPTPAPTNTPEPTAPPTQTFTPSPTPLPTDTPTPTTVPTNTPRPTRTATPVPQPGDVLLTDSFDSNTNNWGTWADAKSIAAVSGGSYSLQVKEKNVFYYSNPSGNFGDVDMTFDVTLVDGANSNTMMGAQCRKRTDSLFYLFAITGDGYYSVAKFDTDGWHDLVAWTASSAIKTGKATNTLRVICSGEVLQLWVNGARLVTLKNDEYPRGNIGLVVGTFTQNNPNSKAAFDNLTVTLPDPITLAAGSGGGSSETVATSTGGGATSAPQATASGNGQLIVVMCQGIETSVTIFHDGQIVKQESLHNAGRNVYELPAGHYDVQFNAEGYYNLNLDYDIEAGTQWTQYIGGEC